MAEKRISEIIAPAFYPMHQELRNGEAVHFWLPGGRGSGKSSAVSVEILLGNIERSAPACHETVPFEILSRESIREISH